MIILLNGPPRSGKDEFIKIAKQYSRMTEYKMSRPLKRGLAAMFNWSGQEVEVLERNKDQTSAMCFGKSYREAQILLFRALESWYGDDVLSQLAVEFIDNMSYTHLIIDTGRQIEADTLNKRFGYGNTALVTIERPDCTFEGDSRELISNSSFKHSSHINNCFDLELYEEQVKKCLRELGVVDNG